MIEESPRWVRGRLGGETVVDSKDVRLLYAPGKVLPVWLFPEQDVRLDLVPAEAVKRHGELVHVEFDALDEWFEEDEPQIGHPPDPHHRIDVRRTSRRIRISIGGRVVVDTMEAKALFETGLPVRWYVAALRGRRAARAERPPLRLRLQGPRRPLRGGRRAGRRLDLRGPPARRRCRVKGLIAFYNERVDIEVDGEPQERPRTQWSAQLACRPCPWA